MKEFICETRLVMGNGALEALKELKAKRLLVVADPFFAQNGWASRVAEASGAESWEVFSNVKPDPSVELVARGTAQLLDLAPDGVVALGGGSAMDCAKAMEYFSDVDIPLVAGPTTSGSGAGGPEFAILTHNGVKHPLVDRRLRPKMAILEAGLLENMPPSLIADSGFDVLAHALEAWVGKNGNPMTEALACDAFRRVFALLYDSYSGDKHTRLEIHAASAMAGLAFTHGGLGVCHALSHALGGQFHVPHGRLNAILLPAVVSANAEAAAGQYAKLSRLAGLGGSSDTVALRNLKNGLIRLRNRLGLPGSLAAAGVEPMALAEKTEEIVSAALRDPCCETNPLPVTAEMLREILREVERG